MTQVSVLTVRLCKSTCYGRLFLTDQHRLRLKPSDSIKNELKPHLYVRGVQTGCEQGDITRHLVVPSSSLHVLRARGPAAWRNSKNIPLGNLGPGDHSLPVSCHISAAQVERHWCQPALGLTSGDEVSAVWRADIIFPLTGERAGVRDTSGGNQGDGARVPAGRPICFITHVSPGARLSAIQERPVTWPRLELVLSVHKLQS